MIKAWIKKIVREELDRWYKERLLDSSAQTAKAIFEAKEYDRLRARDAVNSMMNAMGLDK